MVESTTNMKNVVIVDDYTFVKRLGKPGYQGEVFLVQSNEGKFYAMKLFKRLRDFKTESENQFILDHPNIIKMIAY